jgi:hypothetical protein
MTGNSGQDLQTSPTVRLARATYDEESTSGEFGLVYTRPLSPSWTLETRLHPQFDDFDNVSISDETRRRRR